ncbi:Spy/CpxP family protein refolding chaperone [Phenylobacterium sp.]|uniref:Spy/CpxP family protein refolding chaperone n=1 Tax=Phenylobacterium sp. TaxID=1871053 RepID=UPI0035B48DA4
MTMPVKLRTPLLALAAVAGATALCTPASAQDAALLARPYAVTADQAQRIIAERVLQASLTASLQELHADLQLNDRQERRWRDFVATAFTAPSDSAFLSLAADAGPLARADAKMRFYRQTYENQRRAVAAMKALYGSLSDDQRARLNDGLDSLSTTVVVPAG